jgi:hypothetical protein
MREESEANQLYQIILVIDTIFAFHDLDDFHRGFFYAFGRHNIVPAAENRPYQLRTTQI